MTRGGAAWKLVGLITRRSQVQILPPLPNKNKGLAKEANPLNYLVPNTIPNISLGKSWCPRVSRKTKWWELMPEKVGQFFGGLFY